MSPVKEQINKIKEVIESACSKVGRDPGGVRIVAISKGAAPEKIVEVLEAGVSDIGENYFQEFSAKKKVLGNLPILWHFTGHVQTNKAAAVAENFSLIHSIDSVHLAEKFSQIGEKKKKEVPALIQIKMGKEAGYGFLPSDLLSAAHKLKKDWIQWKGLMMMAPPVSGAESARGYFKETRDLFLRLREQVFGESFTEISMGMSGDFSAAVEEGATLLRIGRAIFGERAPIKS
jgi:pyridoxal phosphate enzyme (YggS family)